MLRFGYGAGRLSRNFQAISALSALPFLPAEGENRFARSVVGVAVKKMKSKKPLAIPC